MNYLVGTPIPESVARSIKDRQKVFEANDGSLRQAYIQYQSLVPWVRLSSSVKIKPNSKTAQKFGVSGNTLAKNNVLFTLFNKETDDLQGYEQTQLGYRPAPGIQDMQIHSHNRFGSLRTAVVRYQCWSVEQLNALELLYMRPGFNVFLEWGWSGYLVNDNGNYNVDTLVNPIDFTSYTTREAATTAMLAKRQSYKYHYDGIAGVIKNFSWTLRNDGGYDCSTYIVTAGDIAESLKINFYFSNKDVQEAVEEASQAIEAAVNQSLDQGMAEITLPDGSTIKLPKSAVDGSQLYARQNLIPQFPTAHEIRLREEISPPDFVNVADPAAGQRLAKLYEEFKARVKNAIDGWQHEIDSAIVQRGLYINPLERTFGFFGNDYTNRNAPARVIAAAERFVANNPDLEVVMMPQSNRENAVIRFKS